MRAWAARRAGLLGAAGALLLVGAVLLAVALVRIGDSAGPGEGARLPAPRAVPDPVPDGPIVTAMPANCGVSRRTARSLAPGSDPDAEKSGLFREGGPGSCMWYSLNDGAERCGFCPRSDSHRKERVLNVDIVRHTGTTGREAVLRAAQELGPAPDLVVGRNPPRRVTGLGSQAVAYYSAERDTEGAIVTFRYGNAVTRVKYTGWDAPKGDGRQVTIPERIALAGALRAAAEAARGLGVRADPVVAEPQPGAGLVRRPPKVCDLVRDRTAGLIAPRAERARWVGSAFPGVPGVTYDTCEWTSRTSELADEGAKRLLRVAVGVVGEWRPGMALAVAADAYTRMHMEGRLPTSGEGFTAVAGLGEQAYVLYRREAGGKGQADVVLRYRNVLAEVTYSGTDGPTEIPRTQAVGAAYTAALDVAAALAR